MPASIRAARTNDIEALQKLFVRARQWLFHHRAGSTDDPDPNYVSWEDFDAARAFVAELDGTAAGFVAWRPMGERTAELHRFFVDPDLWEKGVKTALMEAVFEAVRANGFKSLHASVVPEATHFYRQCGFLRTGATAAPVGPMLTMMKVLDSG